MAKNLDSDNRTIRITFDVVCESPICMQLGDSLNDRIKNYIKMCTEAMEEEMRHWGDHYIFIDPVRVELVWDEDGNEKVEEVNLEDDDEQEE